LPSQSKMSQIALTACPCSSLFERTTERRRWSVYPTIPAAVDEKRCSCFTGCLEDVTGKLIIGKLSKLIIWNLTANCCTAILWPFHRCFWS
jgi:hypothetical protein